MINYKLKSARARRNHTQDYMRKLLGLKNIATYSQKECGKRRFTTDEINLIRLDFNLNDNEVVDIFFVNEVNTNNMSA